MQAYKNCPKFKEDKPSTSPILVRALRKLSNKKNYPQVLLRTKHKNN